MRDINDLSIYFSGHNISKYADVAIRSFLSVYPNLKEQIYYFDDESTDETVELLNELGIKRVTWDTEIKSLYNQYFSDGTISNLGQSQMLRCEFILKSILKQCNTKYLLNLDGDTVTLKSGFIEEYLNSDYIVYGAEGHIHTPYPLPTHKLNDTYNNKFSKLRLDSEPVTTSTVQYTHIRHARVHPYFFFADRETLLSNLNIMNNLRDKEYIALFNNDIIDVGADILLTCMNNNLRYKLFNGKAIYHWTWVSSSIRDKNFTCSKTNEQIIDGYLSNLTVNKELREKLKELGVKPRELLHFLKLKIRTEDYN